MSHTMCSARIGGRGGGQAGEKVGARRAQADHPPSIDIGQEIDNGRGGPVAMSPSGRLWWTFEEQFQLFTAVPYLLAFKAED